MSSKIINIIFAAQYTLMQPIQMVDLKRQYQKIKPEIDNAIQEVINQTAFINGSAVRDFAAALENYLKVKHVIPCANGTDALQIAFMALGLKPGDEVITPSFTYIATVEVLSLLGLKPIFVEVNQDDFCLNLRDVENKIGNNTKAIVPVHLYGQCANMEALLKLAKQYQIAVVEDAAQALGADYYFSDGNSKKAGTMGNIGCTSFFPSKNLGCYGDGGALFTNDDSLAQKIRMIANHGQQKKYYHEVIGVNSRLDTIQAAILKVKLQYLDNYCDARKKVALAYNESFKNIKQIKTPVNRQDSSHVYHQYTLQVQPSYRDELINFLSQHQIPSMIYYPLPIHLQNAFKPLDSSTLHLEISENLCKCVISLPIHTEMDEEQIDFIIEKVKEFFNQ